MATKTKAKARKLTVKKEEKVETPVMVAETKKNDDDMFGAELDPQEEKMLDWILKIVVAFILGWLGLSIVLVVMGYLGIWK